AQNVASRAYFVSLDAGVWKSTTTLTTSAVTNVTLSGLNGPVFASTAAPTVGIDYEQQQSTAVIAFAQQGSYTLGVYEYDPGAGTNASAISASVPSVNGPNANYTATVTSVKVSAARTQNVSPYTKDIWIAAENSNGNINYMRFNGTSESFETLANSL